MTTRSLFLLPGDGIGPETMAEVVKLIDHMNAKEGAGFVTDQGLVGGSAYDAHGEAISDADMDRAMAADAVLFGAVGDPRHDTLARNLLEDTFPLVWIEGELVIDRTENDIGTSSYSMVATGVEPYEE